MPEYSSAPSGRIDLWTPNQPQATRTNGSRLREKSHDETPQVNNGQSTLENKLLSYVDGLKLQLRTYVKTHNPKACYKTVRVADAIDNAHTYANGAGSPSTSLPSNPSDTLNRIPSSLVRAQPHRISLAWLQLVPMSSQVTFV